MSPSGNMSSSSLNILFMTNSEYGQANVILAVAQELTVNPMFKIHVAAPPDLEPRVATINNNGKLSCPITFHSIPIPAMAELHRRQGISMTHSPGIPGAVASYTVLNRCILGWENSEYMSGYQKCLEIIETVKPTALVLDPGLWMANDAARALDLNYVVLTPSSAKEMAGNKLPKGAMFWKYPWMGTGYSYPLSYTDTLKNLYLAIRAIMAIFGAGHIQRFTKVRKEAGIHHKFPMLDFHRDEDLYLSPYLPEIDYPYEAIPANIIACGPIVLPPVPLAETDPDLAQWLGGSRSTVLVNLGTHFNSEASSALELAKGIKTLLDIRSEIQVLWKLKYAWDGDAELTALISDFVSTGRLRVMPWLVPEPSSILETGRIICSVHHGGANSYYEACRAGIPHVVLPVWWDTYEYAARAEWLGIGVRGNKGVEPGVEGVQFGNALKQAVQDDRIRAKARQLGEVCRKKEGRVRAAEEIADWAMKDKP